MSRFAVLLLLASSAAHAQVPVEVEIGKTRPVDVGLAMGSFCDDPSLVSVSLVTFGDHNEWIVTGLKLGTTLCRIGTDPSGPTALFVVNVVPAKPTR